MSMPQTKIATKPFRMEKAAALSFLGKTFYYIILSIITLIIFVPLLLVVFAAFKTSPELSATSPFSLPKSWSFHNFSVAFEKANMLVGLINSLSITVSSVVINAILGAMTAFVLNRFQFRFKKTIFLLFIVASVVPSYTTEVARFQTIKSLGLYNTLFAPLIIYAGTDLMQIFIYLQFIEKISKQLDESALLDGASYFRIFRSILFPLLLPATATLAIIKAVDIMNDMYIPYLYMPSKKLSTLSTALMTFVGERATYWNELSAAIILVMLPTILIYLILRKFIFAGLMDGAMKE
ncbi:Melibiose/raffinose/stachyose import permease protein MelC [Paenibacillus allorhizoplanae]|uniref:Melibiose/raffinose/stachyose import permease protein MelC n=1 Tax=Paenibacillus allorhizoplanae TaxID=2905648 RepID=A0ABN8HAZ0_9BACL|nr:carbohydrate ABC transporter permease [Paenibacillus allorhizoplanae]CAH1231122.1 Melibiose/raffinose/stachyose import permease protein MelC [Paenibacillus allorhizoplanae]